jgi:hypothetical protein
MSNEYPPPGPEQDPTGQSNQPPPPPSYGESQPPPGYGQQGYGQQPGQPPGYPPPPPGAPGGYGQGGYGVPQKTSPLAIVSLVLGIVGFICCTFFVLSIGAVVTGIIARKQIAEAPGTYKGSGMATAGLVLGVLGIIVGIVLWILNLNGMGNSDFTFETS